MPSSALEVGRADPLHLHSLVSYSVSFSAEAPDEPSDTLQCSNVSSAPTIKV